MAKKEKVYSKYLTITQPDGTKKQLRFRGKTRKEAQEKLDKAKLDVAQGLLVFNDNTTFARWAEEYLEVYCKPKQASDTYQDTVNLVARVYSRYLDNLPMSEIKTAHMQECINRLEGKSKSYIRKCVTIGKGIFEKAVANRLIVHNPATSIETIKGFSGKRRALTPAEQDAFFKVAQYHSKGVFFSTMLGCGLRPGEARALIWNNVDFEDGTITVSAAAKRHKKELKGPKSEAGYRTIPMPEWLIKMLENHPKGNSIFVFHGDDLQPMSEQRYLRGWRSFLRCMDIEGGAKTYRNQVIIHSPHIGWDILTPYYLRHTYATKLAEAGVDIKTAQYLLGHSDIKMTAEIYTHVTSKMLNTAREKINLHHTVENRQQTAKNI